MFVKQSDGSYIEAGKEASIISGKVVDDTKDFGISHTGVPPPPPPPAECEDYYIESECIAAGCYWYGGSCHRMPPGVDCSDYASKSTCTAAGCYWYDDKCHSFSKPKEEVEIPWVIILAAVGGAIALIGAVVAIRR